MARPSSFLYESSSLSDFEMNPETIAISAGTIEDILRVAGFELSASRLSTGFIRYFWIFKTSSAQTLPSRKTIFAHLTAGGSVPTFVADFIPSRKSVRHCSALSARWSYCPGRYSHII